MPQITDSARIEREIRTSVQRFNARRYSYNGERVWTHDGGIITVRIREQGCKLLASIQFGYGIPKSLAENLRIDLGRDSEQFSEKGEADFSKQSEPVLVQLEVIEKTARVRSIRR